jgi:hypothetical protein
VPKLSRKAPKSKKKAAMTDVMSRFKKGSLHSGSKSGAKVTNPKQAVAIGLSESGQSKRAGPTQPQANALHRKGVKKANRRPRNKGRS